MKPRERELTVEEEAMFDAQADDAEIDEWLAAWSEDFNSNEWLQVADDRETE